MPLHLKVDPQPVQSVEPLTVSLSANPTTNRVLITLNPPKSPASDGTNSGTRAPLDVCCVIDVSGSMDASADIRGNPALGIPAEKTGLNVLDIVKHSLRTVVATMQPSA